jgi:endoglucanase
MSKKLISFSCALALLITACSAQQPAPKAQAEPTAAPATRAATSVPKPSPTALPPVEARDLSAAAAGTVDAFATAAQLGRGVNFGNALEAPKEGEWGMVLEESFFDRVKEAGFRTIRLPTKWSAHAANDAPYTIDAKFFERVDWAVDNATKRGLNIVVNIHHYEEFMGETDKHTPRFVALWKQIAERYKDRPANVLFELCNEPTNMPAGLWNKIFLQALAAVRASNPTRIVVIGGVDWNSVSGLTQLKLPADDQNLIATFHYYSPHQFTHQGAEWMDGADAWLGTEWKPDAVGRTSIDFDLDKAARWGKENKRPLWMGEFGAYSKADIVSREKWTSYVAREAERLKISWAYWEFGAGFGVYDRSKKAFVPEIKRALLP